MKHKSGGFMSEDAGLKPDTSKGSLEVKEHTDYIVVSLRGVIDSRLRAEAGAAFALIMQKRLPLTVVARQATFADSSSWAFIVQLISECNAAQIPVRVDIRDEKVRAVLMDLGLADVA